MHSRPRGRSPPSARTRKKIKKLKKIKNKIKIIYFFMAVVAGLERENFFSIFNFQFSVFGFQSPKSPNSPSSTGFAGEAARRRRFFSA
jgi:hypothetical protein